MIGTEQYFEELTNLIKYETVDGTFFLIKDNQKHRQLFSDEEGYIIFFKKGKKYKLKASKLAYELGNRMIVPKDKVVLHRNLDLTDYRLVNLKLVTKKVYQTIKEAHKNLSYNLKLLPHAHDVFSYVLTWRENGRDKSLVVQDIVIARRKYLKLQLKYAKILSTYCVFDI